jgi:hypothetical protein
MSMIRKIIFDGGSPTAASFFLGGRGARANHALCIPEAHRIFSIKDPTFFGEGGVAAKRRRNF